MVSFLSVLINMIFCICWRHWYVVQQGILCAVHYESWGKTSVCVIVCTIIEIMEASVKIEHNAV